MTEPQKSPWNSLEVCKILVSTATPLVLFFVANQAASVSKQIESTNEINQRKNERVTQKRIAIYDEVGGKLNDIYCYFTYRGGWKEIRPTTIISYKRSLDKEMYSYRPLFSDDLFLAYNNFMESAFQTYAGWGKDAQLKTTVSFRKQYARGYRWDDKWNVQFTNEEDNGVKVHNAYQKLMAQFSKDLGLTINPTGAEPKSPPGG